MMVEIPERQDRETLLRRYRVVGGAASAGEGNAKAADEEKDEYSDDEHQYEDEEGGGGKHAESSCSYSKWNMENRKEGLK